MSAEPVYLLFEHASGYALLQVKETEELGLISAQAEAAGSDSSWSPTRRSRAPCPRALENGNAISEGVLHEELRAFLQNNLPKTGKPLLGVGHSKLADSIKEELGRAGSFPELTRCCRQHFPKLVRGLSLIGLAHGYSRAKLKFNVNRADNMIIQAINLLDQLDKDINTFAMRVREWYGYHFPNWSACDDNPTSWPVASFGTFASRISAMIGARRELHTYLIDKMTQDQSAARADAHAGLSGQSGQIIPASTVQYLAPEGPVPRHLKLAQYAKPDLSFHLYGKAAREHKGRVSRYLASKVRILIICF
uniref:NOSIC domain-containing protein n=1 Tax=Macrostomum lignano TaxID=282301 RepID=A0A1I8IY79_9PLAT